MRQCTLRAVEVLLCNQRVDVAIDSEHGKISCLSRKPWEAVFGVGGSTRSLLAASEQDFGVPKQNLRGALRFVPIFYRSLSFRTGRPDARSTGGRDGPQTEWQGCAHAIDKRMVLSVIP
ncbi:hypothetical protein GD429_29755 [Burkholderia sp. BE17]|nr:hypothetical protein [Burkholderia sp. BE17]